MKALARFTLLIGLLLTALSSQAEQLTLDQLSQQLSQHPVVRGPFIQEKHLRALPQPLTSSGTFVLAADAGLLWKLEKPLKQDYRIDANGIAKRTADGWQMQPGRDVAAPGHRRQEAGSRLVRMSSGVWSHVLGEAYGSSALGQPVNDLVENRPHDPP